MRHPSPLRRRAQAYDYFSRRRDSIYCRFHDNSGRSIYLPAQHPAGNHGGRAAVSPSDHGD